MTPSEARDLCRKLRIEIKQLACAAADRSYRDMLAGSKARPAVPDMLDIFDKLAMQMQAPSLALIDQLEQIAEGALTK